VPDGAPRDWSEAFAALPLETPPDDSWPRIVRAQNAHKRRGHRSHRERHTTWLIGLASAAVLVAAAWSPMSHWLQDRPADTTSPTVTVTAPPGARDLTKPMQTPSSAGPEAARVAIDSVEKPSVTSHADRDGRATVAPHPRSARAARKTATRVAAQPTKAPPQTTAPVTSDSIAAASPATSAVHDLQVQSARLEALVAIARDERVGNASSELLSAELDASIGAVDAALSHDDLDDTHRQQLWQQRVDLLQQLAGVESTARWLAAQGMSNETALVSVD
jgi:cytoskeletal protein RodZ